MQLEAALNIFLSALFMFKMICEQHPTNSFDPIN
jgi:hypothetical protein